MSQRCHCSRKGPLCYHFHIQTKKRSAPIRQPIRIAFPSPPALQKRLRYHRAMRWLFSSTNAKKTRSHKRVYPPAVIVLGSLRSRRLVFAVVNFNSPLTCVCVCGGCAFPSQLPLIARSHCSVSARVFANERIATEKDAECVEADEKKKKETLQLHPPSANVKRELNQRAENSSLVTNAVILSANETTRGLRSRAG